MNFSNYYTYLKRYKCFLIVFKFMHYILFLFVTTWQNQFVTDRVYPKSDLHKASYQHGLFHSLPIFFIWYLNHFEKSIYNKKLAKNEKLGSYCLETFLHGTSKPRNHDFRYLICHFFFNCNFSIYMYLFLISCCKQTLIIGIHSKVSVLKYCYLHIW